jgi:mannose-6-phosphate isomerase-like protein (cupin superfamily)
MEFAIRGSSHFVSLAQRVRNYRCQFKDVELAESLRGTTHTSPPYVESSFDGVLVQKSWGHEYQLFANTYCAIWCLDFNGFPGMSLHCHPNADSCVCAIQGNVKVETLCDSIFLEPGDGLILEKGVFHQIRAGANTILLETISPPIRGDLLRFSNTDKQDSGTHNYVTNAQIRQMQPEDRSCWIKRDANGCYEFNSSCFFQLADGTEACCVYGALPYIRFFADSTKLSLLGLFAVTKGTKEDSLGLPSQDNCVDVLGEFVGVLR